MSSQPHQHAPANEPIYVHGHSVPVLRAHAQRTPLDSAAFLPPHLRSDTHLLDVGCGPGSITNGLAAYCPHGRVVGVDPSTSALDYARLHYPDISFVQAQAHELPFSDAVFDVVYAHQVMLYLPDAMAALAEFFRVLRPGGLVAVRDAAGNRWIHAPDHSGLGSFMKTLMSSIKASGGDPDIGRSMPRYFRQAGLENVKVSTSSWCVSTESERIKVANSWIDRLSQGDMVNKWILLEIADEESVENMRRGFQLFREDENAFFVHPNIEVVGRKPA